MVEAWSIEDKPVLRFPIIRYDLPVNEDINNLDMSPDGSFVVAKGKLLHISDGGVINPLPLLIKAHSILKFDHGTPRFAKVEQQGYFVTIDIYEIKTNQTLQCLASHRIEVGDWDLGWLDVQISFARTQNLVFAYTFLTESTRAKTCLATVEDSEITIVDICDGTHSHLN